MTQTRNRHSQLLRATQILIFATATLVLLHAPAQSELCELSFTACPEGFNGDTIYVDTSVVALSANIFVCDPRDVIEGQFDSASPPSIVFVIDHSFSMMGLGATYPGNDTYGSRFEVVSDLIDTVANYYPDAEIGVVVFREVLFFDHRNNNAFTPLPGFGDQSYLPLTTLNATVSGSKTGLDRIHEILETDTIVSMTAKNGLVEHVNLKYTPQFPTVGNTNINVAFLAAQEALKSATNPKQNQYIIFLSDGEPHNPPDSNQQHANLDKNWFTEGTNMPTTFAVFFDADGKTPLSLQVMTQNIRENGYSTTNPASGLWTIQTNYNNLMALLLNNFVKPLLLVIEATAKNAVVNNTYTSVTRDAQSFLFPDRFPLTGTTTPFTLDIGYQVKTVHTGAVRDTTIRAQFYVTKTTSATTQDGVAQTCWDQPILRFYYHGQPVSAVDETMDTLTVRLDPLGTVLDSASVRLSTTRSTPFDLEYLKLNPDSTLWTGTFVRSLSSKGATLGNGKIEHAVFDSIVALYRNPSLATDTVRAAIAFAVSKSVIVRSASYFDRTGDGTVDSLFFAIDGSPAQSDITRLLSLIALPSFRRFAVDTSSLRLTLSGLEMLVTEQRSGTPITHSAEFDTIAIRGALLEGGGWVQDVRLNAIDNIAPVIIEASVTTFDNGIAADTLTVVFSEPMNPVTSVSPFSFRSSATGQTYSVTLSTVDLTDRTFTGTVTSSSNENGISTGDSIWINPVASVSDKRSNTQTNANNRRAAVTVTIKRDPVDIVVTTVSNPFEPDGRVTPAVPAYIASLPEISKELQDSRYRSGSSLYGTVIIAGATNPDKTGRFFSLNGKLSIYDVVNNRVLVDREMAFDNNTQGRTKQLYYVWDGRNENGRYVATGTYVAVISITDDQGKKSTKTVRLGVKR